jgi:transposase
MRNVPGRKTDVADAQWGAQLLEHGLVRPSFIPDRRTREERDLTRYRKVVIEDRGREVQRLHKVLEDAGIKLASFTSSVLTVSGREMIEALIAGQRDPTAMAEMARGRMRAKIPQLTDALAGRFNDHHAMLCRTMLARIDQADATIAELSARIVELQHPHEAAVQLLVGIPGVSYRTAQVILAEIGTDMSRFPTAGHLASWAGMCPGNNESAGKHRNGRTRYGSKWLHKALIEAAKAAARTKDSYLSAHYHRIRGRRGTAKATIAVGHSILVICWHLLTTGETYTDLGNDYFDKRRTSTAHQRRLIAQLEAMGHKVTLEPAAA